MQLGIFAKTFTRGTLAGTLDAVASQGLNCVQFNFACVGLSTLPDRIEAALADQIRRELQARQITMAAVSGTVNLIHPSVHTRRDGLSRLKIMIAACRQLGTSVITLCTGTRDPENMWRRHPDNDSLEAWCDLLASLTEALSAAEANDVILAFEPEVANVIDSAPKGRRLLDELKSSHLKVVMDGANLFHSGGFSRTKETLNEAFDLLGDDIVIAHAKDLTFDGERGYVAAGKGILDYDHYLSLLHAVGFDGPLILHGLEESEVPGCVRFLQQKLSMLHGSQSAL